ncbi:MAG TPA: glycosyltransferase family 4 protein [Jatrophihabitans sp.]|jgi:glycosyltransferase involved in cell wall biosynthesis|nr:glycosyltransferase family 4 protein [Jatrophihabitans sp.]
MRIVHVSDCYLPRLGGIEQQVSELAARQQRAGHDVEVITSVGGPPGGGPVRVHRPSPRPDGSIRYHSSYRSAGFVTSERYDVVHVHLSTWSPLAFLAVRSGCRAGLPVAATVHSLWGHVTPLWRGAARAIGWRDWPVAWSAVSGAAAVPVSGALGPTPVSIVPNGVDPRQWTLPERPRDPRRVVLASVMRLAPRKRPRQLLRMLAALRQEVAGQIRLEAVLIGDGPLRTRLAGDAQRLGLADWVRFTGTLRRPAIREVYRDSDIYVAPATLESFGIAALEARTAGLPVVAQAGTGVADFVQHGVHGLLADGDPAMVHALAHLVADPEMRAAISAYNRSRPPESNWSRVLADCDALYARAAHLAARPVAMASP